MTLYLTQAEQLYKDGRYEEALAVIEEALRIAGHHPDSHLYSDKATILERLAQQAYEVAKQGGYSEDKQEEAIGKAVASLNHMSLTEIADRCKHEIENYRHNKSFNDQYCLEIFHRAIVKHDPDSWELLYQRFSPTVRAWMSNHPQRDVACRYQSEEDYVHDTFDRVWQASSRNTLEFDSLAAALRYLKLCLQGAIVDTIRAYSRSKEVPLPDPGSDTPYIEESSTEDDYESQDVWGIIKSLLPNDRERSLAYLLYRCGLKPREIVRYRSDEFSDMKEVYRLQRSIVERLRRNRDQFRWHLSDVEL